MDAARTRALANADEYQAAALRTAGQFDSQLSAMLCATLGLVGESGEVADYLKKALFQGHPFDPERFIEELGDVAWYLALGADAVGVALSTVFGRNIDKLAQRYLDGFSPEASINRAEGVDGGQAEAEPDGSDPARSGPGAEASPGPGQVGSPESL